MYMETVDGGEPQFYLPNDRGRGRFVLGEELLPLPTAPTAPALLLFPTTTFPIRCIVFRAIRLREARRCGLPVSLPTGRLKPFSALPARGLRWSFIRLPVCLLPPPIRTPTVRDVGKTAGTRVKENLVLISVLWTGTFSRSCTVLSPLYITRREFNGQ